MSLRIFVLTFVGLVFLGGCNSKKINPPLLPTKSPTIETPTIAIPTPSASTTASLTPLPTLSVDEARSRLVELLQNSSGCQLPCWWGLTPGRSTTQEAFALLTPLGSLADFNFLYPTEHGVLGLVYHEGDLLINTNVGYQSFEDGTIIKRISILIKPFREFVNKRGLVDRIDVVYDAMSTIKYLNSYTLQNILSTYGPPTQVLIRVDICEAEVTCPSLFYTTLLYSQRGIFIRLTANAVIEDHKKVQGCPSNSTIELDLLPPDETNSYDAILSSMGANWEGNFPSVKMLTDVTQMTVSEFYNTFKEPTEVCLEVPYSIWPRP